jgi:hypothetical protein
MPSVILRYNHEMLFKDIEYRIWCLIPWQMYGY